MLTFLPDCQCIPSSSFGFPGPSACCGFSAGSSSKLSLQTCQGDETHERTGSRSNEEERDKRGKTGLEESGYWILAVDILTEGADLDLAVCVCVCVC